MMELSALISSFIEDYQAAGSEEKDVIIDDFFQILLSSPPFKISYIKKTVNFSMNRKIPLELKEVLLPFAHVEYTHIQSSISSNNPFSLLKQRILNLYARSCDPTISFQPSYHECMRVAKKAYYKILKGQEYTAAELDSEINDGFYKARKILELDTAWKMPYTLDEYLVFVKGALPYIFGHYKEPGLTNAFIPMDFIDEDHYAISYLSKCLLYRTLAEQKRMLGLNDRGVYALCPKCEKRIVDTNKHKFCTYCRGEAPRKLYATCSNCSQVFKQNLLGRSSLLCPDCRSAKHRIQKSVRPHKDK